MKKILNNELYRAFINKKMLTVLVIEAVFITIYTILEVYHVSIHEFPFYLSTLETEKPIPYLPGALHEWIGLRHSSFSVILFTALPLLAAIPYGNSLYVDEESHYINQLCIRSNKKNYFKCKLICTFLSGGVVAVFPFALSFIFNTILLPIEPVQVSSGAFFGNMTAFAEILYWNPIVYVLIYLAEIFIVIGLLNCMCFVMTSLLTNRYVVTIVPFTVFFASGLIGNFTNPNMAPWAYVKLPMMYKSVLWMVAIQIILAVLIIIGAYICKSFKRTDII